MSTATVRQALVDYFENAAIPGLNKVFKAPPWYADGRYWNMANSLGSGSVGFVHLAQQSETRIALPALTGQKMVHYTVGLVICYQSLQKSAAFTPTAEDDWTGDLDATIDGVLDLLRADPNAGAPSTVWQMAQDADDLSLTRDLPLNLEGKVLSWNAVEFHVTEVVTA